MRTPRRPALVGGLALLVLLGGAWVGAYAAAGDGLPSGARISGVDVGGMSPSEAESALRAGLAETVAEPIEVAVRGRGGGSAEVTAGDAGLSVDWAASVAEAGGGRSWDPRDLWDRFAGGEETDAVVRVDDAAFDRTLERLEGDLGTEPTDGAVTFVDGEARVSEPADGRGLDPEGARSALAAAYLSGEPAELAITDLAPDIDADDVAEAVEAFADPALSAPVTLTVGSEELELRPEQYADALTLTPADGELEPGVDPEALGPVLDQVTAGAGEPVDARIEVRRGKPRVVPGKPAVTYDPADVATALLAVVTRPEGERTAEVEGTVRPPDLTTKEARALGVREKVSEFTTEFPYAEYRNTNIGRAAEIVDGTLLQPGEVFSLNDIVGERTRENGFTEGFIISNGIFKQDLGGGVSQMATTTFNAMFFAGLEDIEHKPHSFYIDRYPVGREATVAWPTVDLRFRNDTDHGVLITADLKPSTPSSSGAVTVQMWSTKVWDVESVTSDRYAFTSPATRTLDTPDCYANSGYGGFTVDVTRIFKEPGSEEVVKREKFNTVYTPSDTVRCVPPGSLSGGGGGGGNGGGGGAGRG
ncbi:VanW family protein [Nocardioides litoris]|uniref:VanW family protein n=1 Tax=Nocardioides litoris TaxID=1926648 RepID=UPI001120290B|nr:VanW family protein [Nocardioides litoris]